jgi:hypothetical protein
MKNNDSSLSPRGLHTIISKFKSSGNFFGLGVGFLVFGLTATVSYGEPQPTSTLICVADAVVVGTIKRTTYPVPELSSDTTDYERLLTPLQYGYFIEIDEKLGGAIDANRINTLYFYQPNFPVGSQETGTFFERNLQMRNQYIFFLKGRSKYEYEMRDLRARGEIVQAYQSRNCGSNE